MSYRSWNEAVRPTRDHGRFARKPGEIGHAAEAEVTGTAGHKWQAVEPGRYQYGKWHLQRTITRDGHAWSLRGADGSSHDVGTHPYPWAAQRHAEDYITGLGSGGEQ